MPTLVEPQKKLFTVEEYYRMADTGILRPDERVELIEGEIVAMSPMGSRHAFVAAVLAREFHKRESRVVVYEQKPLRLSALSEPEPDIMLLHPPIHRYVNRHPTFDDVILLIEVADSSCRSDRSVKFPLYARHGIQEAWLVDLEAEAVEVHRSPSDRGFQEVATLREDAALSPLAFPDCVLTVNAILGKE